MTRRCNLGDGFQLHAAELDPGAQRPGQQMRLGIERHRLGEIGHVTSPPDQRARDVLKPLDGGVVKAFAQVLSNRRCRTGSPSPGVVPVRLRNAASPQVHDVALRRKGHATEHQVKRLPGGLHGSRGASGSRLQSHDADVRSTLASGEGMPSVVHAVPSGPTLLARGVA